MKNLFCAGVFLIVSGLGSAMTQTLPEPDPTGTVTGEGVYLPANVTQLAEAFAGVRSDVDDPRIAQWIALQQAGQYRGLVTATEADLRSGAPHPYATHVWSWAQWKLGNLNAERWPEFPLDLSEPLGLAARAFVWQRTRRTGLLAQLAEETLGRSGPDYWADYEIAYASCGSEFLTHCRALGRRLVEHFPHDFGAAYLVGGKASGDLVGTVAWLEANPEIDAGPAGRLIRWMVSRPDANAGDKRAFTGYWLAQSPNDPNALRRLAYQHEVLFYPEEALPVFEREHAVYPFRDAPVRVGRAQAVLRRFDDVFTTAQGYAREAAPDRDVAGMTARALLRMYAHAGEYGRLREVAIKALEIDPTDAVLRILFGEALRKEGFPNEAVVTLAPVLQETPAHYEAANQFVRALDSAGRPRDIVRLAESYRTAGGVPNENVLNFWHRALIDLGLEEDRDALMQVFAEELPDAVWLRGNAARAMNKVGRTQEAFEVIRDIVMVRPESNWRIRRMGDYARAVLGNEGAQRVLEQFLSRYPYRQPAWEQLSKSGLDPVDTWEVAITKAPVSAFPVTMLAKAMQKRDPADWETVHARLGTEIDRMRGADAADSEIAKVLYERARQLDDALFHAHLVDLDVMRSGLGYLDEARDLGLALDDYWSLRYFLLSRAGASWERTFAALRRIDTHPDQFYAYGNLFGTETARYLGNSKQPFIYFQRYLDRQPRSSERLTHFAHLHNKWGGAAVVALSLLDRAKRWDAEADVDAETESASGALGAHKRFFDATYNRRKSISGSLRYVNWFHYARAKTDQEQLIVKSLDLESMKVVQIRPDGIEWERQFDSVTGGLTAFRLGAVRGAVSYTEDGYLAGMKIGRQPGLQFEYAPLAEGALKRHLSVMQVEDGKRLAFEYGPHGKLVVIRVEGIGQVEFTYLGNILKDTTDTSQLMPMISAALARFTDQKQILSDPVGLLRDSGLKEDFFWRLEVDDPELEAARVRRDDGVSDPDLPLADKAKLELELATMLVGKVADHPDHARDAEENLRWLFLELAQVDADEVPEWRSEQTDALGIEAIRQWRKLMLATRPNGMHRYSWAMWRDMRAWLDGLTPSDPQVIGALAQLWAEIDQGGLKVLSNAGWLKTSHLTNPGYWRMHRTQDVFPKALIEQGLQMRDVLVRRNGDAMIVSDKGFSVLRRGFWEWFGYDALNERFSATTELDELTGASNLLAVGEDEAGRLWLGGRAGLFMIEGGYDAPPRFWRSGDDGFLAGGIEAMAVNGAALAVGGAAGLAVMDLGSLTAAVVDDTPVERLRAADEGWLVMGRSALAWWTGDGMQALTDYRVTDARLGERGETLFVLRGKTLSQAPWEDARAGEMTLRAVEGQESIEAVDTPYGLAWVEVLEDQNALMVLTDRGGAVMGEGSFETFSQPGADRPVGIEKAHERDGRLFMITSEGVAAIVGGQAHYASSERVHDLVSDPVLGVTYVALGHELQIVDHKDDDPRAEYFSGINARILELDAQGGLLSNDASTIVRFARGSVSPRELFLVVQTGPDGKAYGDIQDILAAADGSIWVVAGASVFRWREGDEAPQEFSMFLEDAAYPVRSDMLYRVHEHPDGRILLVASNEGHRSYANRSLDGGLFEFDGEKFVKTKLDVLGSWFLTSLTKIDENTAIAGTASGFARVRGNAIDEYDQIDESSYLALRDVNPALYLGTQGVRLGKDLWLFGSAGGVVAYKAGTWFYADRLNWILPRQDLANYGARTIHAMETDARGRVYVGTDWGLTIYDPDGAGAESFLISERRGDFAFSALEQDRMQQVNDILLDALPEDSEAGKMAKTFRKSRKQIVALEAQLSQAQIRDASAAPKIEKKLLKLRQRDIAILAKLERDQPALFTMLQLNPLDLRALGKRLPDDVLVAQYLPTDGALYVNLVSNEGATLKTVKVKRSDLDAQIRIAATNLAAQARGQKRGFGTKVGKKVPESEQTAAEALEEEGGDDSVLGKLNSGPGATEASLKWLYDVLLRPIEHSVPEGATLVVSPNGALAYLPFGALIRDVSEQGPEYAVQHFDLATAPSLYAVDMMIDAIPSTGFSHSHVVFGDPDGTLPHAREEADQIADILGEEDRVELRVGEEATYGELLSNASDARFVHLATHGKLDHRSPKDSYLLLADNTRMSIPQIMTLPMEEAELVFLSACESGLGTDGLEYRTIAHAFAHAGAPAVVATLWQVDDKATRTLAEGFYAAKMDGDGNAAALRRAQRAMIEAGGKHAAPGYWAGVSLFGQP